MTKKEARARREAWTRAVDEGRVVNYGGASMQEFKTVAEARAAVADADCAEVFIVMTDSRAPKAPSSAPAPSGLPTPPPEPPTQPRGREGPLRCLGVCARCSTQLYSWVHYLDCPTCGSDGRA